MEACRPTAAQPTIKNKFNNELPLVDIFIIHRAYYLVYSLWQRQRESHLCY